MGFHARQNTSYVGGVGMGGVPDKASSAYMHVHDRVVDVHDGYI